MKKKKKLLMTPDRLAAMELAMAVYLGISESKVDHSKYDHIRFTKPVYIDKGILIHITSDRSELPKLIAGSPTLIWREVDHVKLNEAGWSVYENTGELGRTSKRNKKSF